MEKGYRFTQPQLDNMRRGHLGQVAWNQGSGGCRRGHDPELYVTPPSGIAICLGCKRENNARYRAKNKEAILFKSRLARYDLSPAAFQVLWEQQAGSCAICAVLFEGKEYRIDHDHETGAVRGILCMSCNTGIGLLQDSATILCQAAAYLTEPPAYGLDADVVKRKEQELASQQSLF